MAAKLREYEHDLSYENDQVNMMPDISEVKNIIEKLKNKKATSDVKNELIKQGGENMTKMIYEWIKIFWLKEENPLQWNEGIITSLWKKKETEKECQIIEELL